MEILEIFHTRLTWFLIHILIKVLLFSINLLGSVLSFINLLFAHINMCDSPKKRKRNNVKKQDKQNNTVVNRGFINANWENLLASSLLMEKKTEKPQQENKKPHYDGPFRRARKNKNPQPTNVENNLKTLNLQSESTHNNTGTLHNGKPSNTCNLNSNENSTKTSGEKKLTKFIAMDCEMVGIGYEGGDHMLARVSLVNKFGDCIYDKFVKPREEVVDYRTDISGVRREDLLNGEEFSKVQKEVSEIIRGRILVGHSLTHDLSVLFLSHPKKSIRDTAKYKPFRKITKGSTPSLKRLAKELLGVDIQHGEHSSVEDARAAMKLYCTVAKNWEAILSQKRGYSKKTIEE